MKSETSSKNNTAIDFSSVTEVTGYPVTREQIQRMYTRYRFAAEFCREKDVLEVACGSGQGLGYLARTAKTVVGGDIDEKILAKAREYYGNTKNNIELRVLNAGILPFDDCRFDVVILYEAIYYLANPEEFIKEALRTLRRDGILVVCSANKELPDFNPSPYSYRYFSATELYDLLLDNGFGQVELFADCPIERHSIKALIISAIKKTAVKLQLMPKTMKGKELFKRIFWGSLSPLPSEVNDAIADYTKPVKISSRSKNMTHKVIFAVGSKKD